MKKLYAVLLAAVLLCLALPVTASAAEDAPLYHVIVVNGNFGNGHRMYDSADYKLGEIVTIHLGMPITGASNPQLIQWHAEPPVVFVDGTSETTSPAKFIMPSQDVRIEAEYATAYWIFIKDGNFDGGSAPATVTGYVPGETVTIYSMPRANGTPFAKWHIGASVVFVDGTSETSSPAKFIMPEQPLHINAEFAKLTPWQWILKWIFFGWLWMK